MFSRLQKRLFTAIPGYKLENKALGSLALIGEAGSLFNFYKNSLEKFNSDIFYFWYGETKHVVLAHQKYIKSVAKLTDKNKKLCESVVPLFGEKSLVLQNNPEHARIKEYVYPIFSMKSIKSWHFSSIQKVIRDWTLPQISKLAESSIKAIDLTLGTSFRVIISTTFGSDINDQEICNLHIRNIENLINLFSSVVTQGPIEQGTDRYNLLTETQNSLQEITLDVIARSKAGELPTVLASQLNQGQDTQELVDQIKGFFIGGTHTTGQLLNWILYLIGKHPEVQDKLHQELDRWQFEEVIDYRLVPELKYTRNIIDEALRYTCFTYTQERFNTGPDIPLPGGYTLEQGSGVSVFTYPILHDKLLYPNPDQFNPDRFDDPNSRRIYFQPFGFQGGRVCPGSNLGNLEMLTFIASIFKKYKVVLDGNYEDLEIVYTLNSVPSKEIFLKFLAR